MVREVIRIGAFVLALLGVIAIAIAVAANDFASRRRTSALALAQARQPISAFRCC